MTTDERRRARAVAVAGSLGALVLLGACGTDPGAQARAGTLQEALGLDGSAFQEREAKVQEKVRRCMEEEGFEYVPVDPSAMDIRTIGPGSDDDAEFRRTRGYGITTTLDEQPAAEDEGSSDPNQAIREALSEADRKAYDTALYGQAAEEPDGPGGGFSVRIGPGPAGSDEGVQVAGSALEDAGCFGKAHQEAGEGDKLERLGPELRELEERITSDPRMVAAETAWATCMARAGHDFESPDDIPPHLFDELRALQDAQAGDGAARPDGGPPAGPPVADSPELAALQQEELAIARADDECSESTGRRVTAKKVRAEAERRFLEDNPGIGDDGGEG